jgi:RHS repeat-associated protein
LPTIGGNTATNYFYTKDHLGSIREVVANDGHTIEGRYNYGPWGDATYMDYSGGNVGQPDFGYAGYFQSKYVPGLDQAVNRLYEPSMHQWLSRDPTGETGGLNLYGYAGNDPINNIDPSGLVFLAGNSHPNNGPWTGADTAAIFVIPGAVAGALIAAESIPALLYGGAAAAPAAAAAENEVDESGGSCPVIQNLTEAARAAMGKGPLANPGAPLTSQMLAGLQQNAAAAQNALDLAKQGLNVAGNPIDADAAQMVIQNMQNRLDTVQQIIGSGVQAPKN